MRVEKNKRKAIFCRRDGMKSEVNFFLSQYAEAHTGKELILDVLNSDATFIPAEDIRTGEIFFINKQNIMFLELHERDLADETLLTPEAHVQVELTNNEILKVSLFMEMPQERSRVSDYLNFSSEFIYLCGQDKDIILNKAFVSTVKDI